MIVTSTSYHLINNTLFLAILFSVTATLNGQGIIYDFGTETGSHIYGESTVFLPVPPCGTARVSVGGGGAGSFHLENPGLLDFGTDTELRCQASQNGNADKFSIYNCEPAIAYYMSFNFRLDNAADGSWFFCAGDGNSYESDASASGSQVFTNLQWKFGIDGTITTKYRNGPTFTNLPAGTFSQGVTYFLELYMNNSVSDMYYLVGPDLYYVDPANWDMWVNGVMVANDLEAGMLSVEDPIDSWMFYSSKSDGNLATLYLDDINLLPLDYLLPITLESFELTQNLTQVDLNWTTGSEQNTTTFDIERSIDGQNFSKIGEITAAGSSAALMNYNFIDVDPRPGINYYQLKINYSDGTSEQSNVILTEEQSGTSGLLGIYPCPATHQISIKNQSYLNEESIMIILDITGNRIREFNYSNSSIDVSDLNSGIYLMVVKDRESETCSYFVKQ